MRFDPRKAIEKTRDNQLQWHPYGIIIVDNEKLQALDSLKLIEICRGETDDDTDTHEIVIVMSEGKNKALNMNKNLPLSDVSSDLKKFITNNKKTIEYFPG
jgi:hypothetical protein